MKVPFKIAMAIVAALVSTRGAALAGIEQGVDAAAKSQVASITLPAGAYRSTNQDDVSKFEEALNKIAARSNARVLTTEVLVWQGSGIAKKQIPERLKAGGFSYTARAAFAAEPGRITPISAARKDKSKELLGMWIETGENLLLAWGVRRPSLSDTPAPVKLVEASPAPDKGSQDSGTAAASIVGTWTWTTIGSINYQDTMTKKLADPSGMSAKFTFTRNGRFTKYFYVRQRTYSLVTESTTTSEGTYKDNGDGTLTLVTEKGHYKGHTGSRIIDRPMTEAERTSGKWYYEWRNEDGKRKFYFGPSRERLSPFKRAE